MVSRSQSHLRTTPLSAHFQGPAIASLLGDLKDRGLLEDTLVVFSSEFGRPEEYSDGLVGFRTKERIESGSGCGDA